MRHDTTLITCDYEKFHKHHIAGKKSKGSFISLLWLDYTSGRNILLFVFSGVVSTACRLAVQSSLQTPLLLALLLPQRWLQRRAGVHVTLSRAACDMPGRTSLHPE